jgi:O-antigen/teichoic acid export membrane protein
VVRLFLELAQKKNFILFFSADTLNKILPLLVLLSLTKFHGLEVVGQVSNFLALTQILSTVCLNGGTTVLSSVFHSDKYSAHKVLAGLAFQALCLGVLICILVLMLSRHIYDITGLSKVDLIISSALAIAMAMINLFGVWERLNNRALEFAKLILITNTFYVFVIGVYIVLESLTANYLYWALLFSNLLAVLVFSYKLRLVISTWKKRLFSEVKGVFLLGIPLLPHSLGMVLKGNVDKFLITSAFGLSANGLFSLAHSVSGISGFGINSFFNYYSPKILEQVHLVVTGKMNPINGATSNLIYKLWRLSFLLMIFVVFINVCVTLFLLLGTSVERDLIGYILLNTLSLAFMVGYYVFSSVLIYHQKLKVVGSISFGLLIFKWGTSYFLLSTFGIFYLFFFDIVSAAAMLIFAYFSGTKLLKD